MKPGGGARPAYPDLAGMRERLDGPRPPERVRFARAFPVGMRWRARGYVRAVESLMADRPYEQVAKDVGTDAEIVARHAFGDALPPPRPAPRSRVVFIRYVRCGSHDRARVLAR